MCDPLGNKRLISCSTNLLFWTLCFYNFGCQLETCCFLFTFVHLPKSPSRKKEKKNYPVVQVSTLNVNYTINNHQLSSPYWLSLQIICSCYFIVDCTCYYSFRYTNITHCSIWYYPTCMIRHTHLITCND